MVSCWRPSARGVLYSWPADSFGEEARHLQMRVPQQGRKPVFRYHDLPQKRSVAVADQQIGLLRAADAVDEFDGLFRMGRQIGCQNRGFPVEILLQSPGRCAVARGEEAVQKENSLGHKSDDSHVAAKMAWFC